MTIIVKMLLILAVTELLISAVSTVIVFIAMLIRPDLLQIECDCFGERLLLAMEMGILTLPAIVLAFIDFAKKGIKDLFNMEDKN